MGPRQLDEAAPATAHNDNIGSGFPFAVCGFWCAASPDTGNKHLCYIGQDLFLSGKGLGQRIVELVPEGKVVGFIATPGQLNIQPRLDGAKAAIKESGKNITLNEVSTGPTLNEEVSAVEGAQKISS
jgi:ABC-type sugar transport system substrate-binding protein